jgi:hydrogenase maturation protein HypF
MDARATVAAAAGDAADKLPVGRLSARFHRALARTTARACAVVAEAHGLDLVVLSGGVFQNRVLLDLTTAELEGAGLRVLIPELLSPNDGGISYGQAAVAAAGG